MTGVNERTVADRDWLRVRGYLREHRYDLAVTASKQLYPDVPRVAGSPLLASPQWIPSEPLPLDAIGLELDGNAPSSWTDSELRPIPRYSELVYRLGAPAVFENRPTYRLHSAVLDDDRPRMRFGMGEYFDAVDIGESVAHDFAAARLGEKSEQRQRVAIGDPVDPRRRPTNVAVSALTIRHDRNSGDARFLVHWRDPAKVGHAGGLFQVIPVGVFQPATNHPDSLRNDFSLWRCLQREFVEELLGEEEVPAEAGPIDYAAWPAASTLDAERVAGTIRTFCLGMGVDPLTLATDLLTVVVVDAPVFDRLFAGLVSGNSEGELAVTADGRAGHPFTADEVQRLAQREPMQAAGAALLSLAWSHRSVLLGP